MGIKFYTEVELTKKNIAAKYCQNKYYSAIVIDGSYVNPQTRL